MGTATTVDEFLETLGRRYRVLLLGGLATIAHGLSRATKDADVWLEPLATPSQWAAALSGVMAHFPQTTLARLLGWETISPDQLAEAIDDIGMIRIQGLEVPLDVFRIPNALLPDDFDEVWQRALPTEQGLRLPDPLDLIVTKLDTGRDQDLKDVFFLEQQVRSSFGDQLETAAPAEARALLDRYADHVVLARALKNPHEEVRVLALELVREFAESGDPFSIDILHERGEGK